MLARVVIENGVKKIVPLTADCGSGNPCGAIITVYQRTVPNGYLPLGAQYDITQFPVLYSILGTDTIPTASALGLPTLTTGQYVIKATSGINENQADNVLSALTPVNTVVSGDMRSVTSGAVYTELQKVMPIAKKVSSNMANSVDISDLPRGIYLCVASDLYDQWYYYNIGVLALFDTTRRNYEKISNNQTGTSMNITLSGDTLTTNISHLYAITFFKIGY